MKSLKIVHLEDSPADSELLSAMLQDAYRIDVVRVDSEKEFLKAIQQPDVELIISDFSLPGYTGAAALAEAQARRPDIPFICFSGTIGEEAAIDALRAGATDYILKHRPQRMIAAIERALREFEERRSRLQAEAALAHREQEFRALIENALDVITVLDAQGRFTYNSPSIERVLGYLAEELIFTSAFALVHPDDLARAHAIFAKALESPNERITTELLVRHKSGAWRNLELVGKCLLPNSPITGVVINSRDVTEKRQTEAQLLRAQRMECLGVLAGGIAHDLNNILSPILMGSELLKSYVTEPEALGVIETIQASSERGSDIVKQVLSFARGVKGQTVSLELKPLVYEVVKLLRETLPRSIQLQTWFGDDLQNVVCNPTELHQVLMNLCVNARDAMPEGGLLQIKCHNVTLDVAAAARHSVSAGNYVRLSVADTGSGIPAELKSRIFEPFFTTKEEGKGTGLGLSTVLSILKRHGGFVQVESEPGEGAQFQVFLPVAQARASNAAGEETDCEGHGEHILLVDDESAILEMTRVVLENSNYDVAVACEGVQALRTIMADPKRWDLIITDAAMPIMDGAALVQEVHRAFGPIPVLCTTGQASRGLRELMMKAGADLILNKPFTAAQLLSAVSNVLKNRERGKEQEASE